MKKFLTPGPAPSALAEGWADVEITPEPSPEELAALVVALTRMTARDAETERRPASAWAMAGRAESLFGRRVSTRPGWGREVDLVTRW